MTRTSRAVATIVATAGAFATLFEAARVFDAGPQPAILAAVLVLALARRPLPRGVAGVAIYVVSIPLLGIVAGGVGWLLLVHPPIGAVAFTGGMFLSVWLRAYGGNARRLGALVAMPLVGMLVVPVLPGATHGDARVELALIASAGLVALGFVALTRAFASGFGIALVDEPPPPPAPASPAPAETKDEPKRRAPAATTRMAIQMAVALAAAFVTGFLLFPGHWSWTVLTAFIVCSGARGRGDAAYKGVLRLGGALAGTVAAAALPPVATPHGSAEAIAIFTVLFAGVWLRELNYAYWAASMTLVLALLAGSSGRPPPALLGVRLEAILIGAACAVVATWFVLPIRTTDVIRRRLATALVALDDVVVHASHPERARKIAAYERHAAELEAVATPVRWHRRFVARGDDAEHPASWIDGARDAGELVRAFVAAGPERAAGGAVRRAIGASRRAIGHHGKPEAIESGITIGASLAALRATLRSQMESLLDDDQRAREIRRDPGERRGRDPGECAAPDVHE